MDKGERVIFAYIYKVQPSSLVSVKDLLHTELVGEIPVPLTWILPFTKWALFVLNYVMSEPHQ